MCLPLRLITHFTRLDLHHMQAYDVAAERAHVDYLNVVVAAVPVLLFEFRADPIGYMVGEGLDVEAQLGYGDYRYYLKKKKVSIELLYRAGRCACSRA